ncbi:MAG: GTP-binding protein [Candidatus Hodarchaeales archaeon]|jgi:elongation factor 2
MPKFTVEAAQKLLFKRDLVRNLGVIAHIDHGKSTLTDSLLAACGLLAEKVAGAARATDTRDDEQERGITIKTTGISLVHEYDQKTYLVNLQDTPGHVDFSGEVTSALRVVDGALIVVDAVEGVMVQTEVVTQQALAERVRPVMIINKVDRLITEMRMSPDAAYDQFQKIINDFNTLIETYAPPEYKKIWRVDPRQGTVAFGSAIHRFGLTIPALANIWHEKTGKPIENLIKNLWMKNNFVNGVLKPTYEIYQKAEEKDIESLKKVAEQLELRLDENVWLEPPKRIAKALLEKWLPVEKAVLDMVVQFCPSPLEAQKYRFKSFWDGDLESPEGKALLECDLDGPVMITISKMIPSKAKRIIAMGRIFSGTIRAGQKIKTLLPGYQPGGKERTFTTNIQQVSMLMGAKPEKVDNIPAGNVVALQGLRGATASSTITSSFDSESLLPFKALSYAVEPVVTVAIEAKSPSELPKLAEGMQLMELVDPSLKTKINEETGEYLLSGTGELHLEIAVKDLQDLQHIEVTQSEPIVVFRESAQDESYKPSLAKSPNKHNRLWVRAGPLDSGAIKLIEEGHINQYTDRKDMSRLLTTEAGWDKKVGRKVWGMGPEENDPNMYIDATKGVQYLREVKDYIIQGFRWAAREGPLCGEPFYGVRFMIEDVKLHEDPVHRGAGQVMPVSRRACFGALLMADPILLEPIYKVQVQVPEQYLGNVYKVLTRRRGRVIDTQKREGTPLNVIIAEVPVTESFGITTELRSETSGFAFSQMVFDHWQKVPGDPSKPIEQGGGLAREYVEETRKRKGFHRPLPPKPEDYYDKL